MAEENQPKGAKKGWEGKKGGGGPPTSYFWVPTGKSQAFRQFTTWAQGVWNGKVGTAKGKESGKGKVLHVVATDEEDEYSLDDSIDSPPIEGPYPLNFANLPNMGEQEESDEDSPPVPVLIPEANLAHIDGRELMGLLIEGPISYKGGKGHGRPANEAPNKGGKGGKWEGRPERIQPQPMRKGKRGVKGDWWETPEGCDSNEWVEGEWGNPNTPPPGSSGDQPKGRNPY